MPINIFGERAGNREIRDDSTKLPAFHQYTRYYILLQFPALLVVCCSLLRFIRLLQVIDLLNPPPVIAVCDNSIEKSIYNIEIEVYSEPDRNITVLARLEKKPVLKVDPT